MSTSESCNRRGVITAPISPDSELAKVNVERMRKQIEDSIRESTKDYVGRPNTKQNLASLKTCLKSLLLKFSQENLVVVDDYGREITAESMSVEGNTITIPRPAALVPRWMVNKER